METTTINYIAEYYKNKDNITLDDFFKLDETPENVKEQINLIKAMQNKLAEANSKLNDIYAKLYSNKYTPTEYTNIIRYQSRDKGTFYFLASTGQSVNIDDYEKSRISDISTKHDTVLICDGYCFDMATAIIKKLKVNISADNNKAGITIIDEIAVNIFNTNQIISKENKTYTSYEITGLLNVLQAKEFVATMYGRAIDLDRFSLSELSSAVKNNPCTEIILKTAPDCILEDLLLHPNSSALESAKPVYKILGITQDVYESAISRNIIRELFETREGATNKDIFGKTQIEWLNLIEYVKEKETELEFNQVSTNRYSWNYTYNSDGIACRAAKTLNMLMQKFKSEGFTEYYSFGQFCDYVIDGTINQGFNYIEDFCTQLSDYLRMCKPMGIKPILFAGYLRQTHDITARNHKVKVSQEQEVIFKNVYSNYKPVKVGDFSFIAPATTKDVQNEGDQQSNCVASYITRILNGSCLILFMRYTKDLTKSFITMEIKDNKIVQVKGSHNRRTTKDEDKVIAEFAKKKEYVCAYN